MRVLVAIPHYVGPPAQGGPVYGSSLPDARPARAEALRRTILGLRVHLGDRQARAGWAAPTVYSLPTDLPKDKSLLAFQQANVPNRATRLDIVVVVVGDRHALPAVGLPPSLFEVERVSIGRLGGDPRLLGFACHDVLAARAADYDWLGYLEDDTVVADPFFLRKIAFVEKELNGDAVLLPNRFEVTPASRFVKLYVDGPISPHATTRWQNLGEHRSVAIRLLSDAVVLARPSNPHAGCFFLSARQFARWRAQDHFGSRQPLFAGPLESAACLGIMRTFRIYKPVLDNAGFLEAEHLNNREWLNYLD
ncbi:hypothetical protein STVA_50630 [Allostella vacuolata]|nr:hypothetical protein STVA_50630 [Stella vacuolata]